MFFEISENKKPSKTTHYTIQHSFKENIDILHFALYCDTTEPMYYGDLGTNQKCPDYPGVLIFQAS